MFWHFCKSISLFNCSNKKILALTQMSETLGPRKMQSFTQKFVMSNIGFHLMKKKPQTVLMNFSGELHPPFSYIIFIRSEFDLINLK